MTKHQAEQLCIEDVEKMTTPEAWEYLAHMNRSVIGSLTKAMEAPKDLRLVAKEMLEEGFADGLLPGLLEQIALRVIIKEMDR